MRSGFTLVLIATVLFAGGYFVYMAEAICPVPLEYRLGVLDERFVITAEEAKEVIAEAEKVWEETADEELFVYNEEADFTINFVFDDRQAMSDAEDDFKDRLDAAQEVSDSLANTYEDLKVEYDDLKGRYEIRAAAYEQSLADYNAKVEKYNAEGGAPPEEYEALQIQKSELDQEQRALNSIVRELNRLVKEINQVGQRGNKLIETYNRGVNTYNQTFGEPREFTQGDYQGDHINIYTFENFEELELVLAHELGHALHLDHVEGKESIMYFLIGDQSTDLALTVSDEAEFARVCGSGWNSFLERLKIRFGFSY